MAEIPVIALIFKSGPVAQLMLYMLLGLSIATWAIIFNRFVFFHAAHKHNRVFLKRFEQASSLTETEHADARLALSPLAKLNTVGTRELKRILSDARAHTGVKDWSFYLQSQFSMAAERIQAATIPIVASFDHGLIILALTSSIAPFIGLLGTVWGIMNSFYDIGNQGSASLPVVAPGIAEALITTIAGLAVAIPSVFFYNIFIRTTRHLEDDIDEFSDQLMLRLKQDIFNMLYSEKGPRP